ncbi:MAG: hypothetical protein IK066_12505 [Kiritimatiellae bacterium]|nr:hypothetical protein [Kiritimatiellia bacterium]
MKTTRLFLLLALAVPLAAAAAPDADPALIEWSPSPHWSAGVAYTHRVRPLSRDGGGTWSLSGESYDGVVTYTRDWWSLFAFAGATQAHLEEYALKDLGMDPGGGAGLRVNLWQIAPAKSGGPWDVTLKLEGRAEWRETSSDRETLRWFEGFAAAPVAWRLSSARSGHDTSIHDYHAIGAYAGPALSALDGTREFANAKTSFEHDDLVGGVAGVELWLLRNLRFDGRLEYFGDCSFALSCTYLF